MNTKIMETEAFQTNEQIVRVTKTAKNDLCLN